MSFRQSGCSRSRTGLSGALKKAFAGVLCPLRRGSMPPTRGFYAPTQGFYAPISRGSMPPFAGVLCPQKQGFYAPCEVALCHREGGFAGILRLGGGNAASRGVANRLRGLNSLGFLRFWKGFYAPSRTHSSGHGPTSLVFCFSGAAAGCSMAA